MMTKKRIAMAVHTSALSILFLIT